MKKLLFSIFFGSFAMGCFAQSVIYVSPRGNDKSAGTLQRPLKTIGQALTKAQDVSGEVEIILRAGEYAQQKSLEITRSSLKIKAYAGEQVSITGGVSIDPKQCRKVTDPAVASRLQAEMRDKVRVIDLSGSDIALSDLHPAGFGRPSVPSWSEIFVDGQPMTLSRWPNDSMALIGKIVVAGNTKDKLEGRLPIFKYNTDRPSRWTKAENIWISGYFGHGYADDMVGVKSINLEDSTISTSHFTTYEFMTGASFRQWFARNLIEEIDLPGEYVLDVANSKIYFYPPNATVSKVRLSMLEAPIFMIEGVRDVTIEGLTLENSRGIGVYMTDTERVVIDGCRLQNLGNVAVCIGEGTMSEPNVTVKPHSMEAGGQKIRGQVGDVMGKLYQDVLYFRNGGHNNGVRNCYINNVGAGGVNMSGGDRKTLERGENFVENCKISNYNRVEKSYRPGVWVDGVGNRVTKCDITDAPSMAILFHGNDHVIELCYINNVCTEVDDQGAVYYGRDPSERGSVIRYNFFKELSPKHRVTATYHDDGGCGTDVIGNIYLRAGSVPVLIGGGHDNTYLNNIFIDSPCAIHIDNRMQGWGTSMVARDGIIDQRLQAVRYTEPPYSTAYPDLAGYWDENPAYPKRNVISGNLFYKIDNVLHGQTQWGEWCNNWTTNENPGFVDPENPLAGFENDAVVFERIKDFPAIPFGEIGSTLE